MTLLFRTILKDNWHLMAMILAVGIAIYLLVDLFERLDHFLDAAVALEIVLLYFVVKIPLIISQLLPIIFLLTVVIQICLMARNHEIVALQAAGISLWHVVKAVFFVSLIWAGVQLGFSEWLGVQGEQASLRIWQEKVRKHNLATISLKNVWFSEGAWVVHIAELKPNNTGKGFVAYHLTKDALQLESVIRAERFTAKPGGWLLEDVIKHTPSLYERLESETLILPLKQKPEAFRFIVPGTKPQQLSLMQLTTTIEQLEASGSNVDTLRSIWHTKLAYAASLIVMALIGTALALWKSSIMITVPLSLICTLVYYALFTLGTALGERGLISAPLGAWLANLIMASIATVGFTVKFTQYKRL